MKVVVATRNQGKLEELRHLLPSTFDLLSLDDVGLSSPEETGSSFIENARLKTAPLVARGFAAIGDDSGLEVDALDGAPGVRSARFAGPDATDHDNNRKLIEKLSRCDPSLGRRARFRSAVVFALPDGREIIGEGEVYGVIIDEPRGENGFGYDPHFEIQDPDAPLYAGRTMAELTLDEKNQISHRARAYRSLQPQIQNMADGGFRSGLGT
ncbi:MAG: RdgB/HAM1 family non-canonical purine NTP pyrophosphatase [Chloroflexota bacterium]